MSEPQTSPCKPQEILFQYFSALLDLNDFAMSEAAAAKKLGRDLELTELRAKRAAIRARYCTHRPRKTDQVVAYGRLATMAYDRSNIVVERESRPSKSRALITVFNSALGEHWRYAFVLREGRWLIDSLQFRDGRKWRPVLLH